MIWLLPLKLRSVVTENEKRIYIYEMDCYKAASEDQLQRMRISPVRYFNLEGLPSEELAEKLEEFIWERGKCSLRPACQVK